MKIGETASAYVCFRVLTPKWAHEPLSGAGAAVNGGRFNRPGIPALYLSEDPMTALEEYRQDMAVLTPVTLAAYHVGTLPQIDLTGDRPADPPWSDWDCAWKRLARIDRINPPSWTCGDDAQAQGIPAIRFRSTRRAEGVNLALFTDLLPGGTLAVHDPRGDLPDNQTSWT